jgi:uncharacterized protein YkwD
LCLGSPPARATATPPAAEGLQARPDVTRTLYLPLMSYQPWAVNPQSRQASLDFYNTYYLPSDGVAAGWTGNHNTCTPGTTSDAFRAAIAQRINYFRAMAGVPATVTLNAEYNRKAQAAALMMSRNNALNHTPPNTWLCYSSDGATAAGSSNLYLSRYGPDAISGYMLDPGSGNSAAGHRRWILYPQTREMGSGDIPPSGGYWSANALWVFDSHMWESRPATREPYVAWPPPGYVPYTVVYARWSFAYAGATLSGASVSMTSGGANVPLSVATVVNGYGENTVVWIPNGMNDGSIWPHPAADTTYHVTIQNVVIGGQARSFAYDVTVFDPQP